MRGIALDLDNTVVPWHTTALSPAVADWVSKLRAGGVRLCLLTNNYGAQAFAVARALGIPLVKGALKPAPPAFRRALLALETPAEKSAVIGDQLFTDVLGGKLLGMRTVLVKPIGRRELPTTKLLRLLEAPVLAKLRRCGRL
jgi:HAD superfamily phosphatase (TIGR01668 family)